LNYNPQKILTNTLQPDIFSSVVDFAILMKASEESAVLRVMGVFDPEGENILKELGDELLL
jgi:hypothetical protein